MKGECRKLPEESSKPFFFQRRSERLDWRKIASLDLEKIVEDGDVPSLEEFLTPVLFSRAEAEFDKDKTDPGFIKVFKVSQLLGEYLLVSCERSKVALDLINDKHKSLEGDKEKVMLELESLKETLMSAKKELKKTKEVLASTQTQVLGSENKDEIDLCPYCSKRFLTPFYLLAHIQRRHQGLPLPDSLRHSLFPPSPGISFSKLPVEVPLPTPSPTVYAFTLNPNEKSLPVQITSCASSTENNLRRDSETQTNIPPPKEEEEEAPLVHKTSSGEICDLVEKYLEQKRIPSQNTHYDQILSSIYKRGGGKEDDEEEEEDRLRKRESLLEFERIEANVCRMKDEFESQWTHLEGKVRDSGIQELKSAFLSEIKKVQELILTAPPPPVKEPPPQEIIIQEEEGKKGEELNSLELQFQKLSDTLQSKMRLEVGELRGELEAQERLWSNKMETMELEHQAKLQRLEQENNLFEKEEKELKASLIHTKDKPTVSTLLKKSEEKVLPVAKPRGKLVEKVPSPTPHFSMEELNEAEDYSTSEEVIPSEYLTVIQPEASPLQVSDYSSSHHSSSSSNGPERGVATPNKKYVFDSSQGKIIEAHETKSQMDLVRDRILLNELDKQVQGLGVDPSSAAISYQEMSRALKHLKGGGGERREEIKSLRKEVRQEVALNSLERKVLPLPHAESGRLFSIFKKVKKSSSSWRHKVASAMKRKGGESSFRKDEAIKTTFFSKWGLSKGNKERNKKSNKGAAAQESQESSSDEEEEDEEDSVEIQHPYMTRSQPILLTSPKKVKKQSDSHSSLQSPKNKKLLTNKKCPNFFVQGSPLSNSYSKGNIPVTSNGWGEVRQGPPPPSSSSSSFSSHRKSHQFTRTEDKRRGFRTNSDAHLYNNPPPPSIPPPPESEGGTSVWEWETEEEQEIDEEGQEVFVTNNKKNKIIIPKKSYSSSEETSQDFPSNYHKTLDKKKKEERGRRDKNNSWDSD